MGRFRRRLARASLRLVPLAMNSLPSEASVAADFDAELGDGFDLSPLPMPDDALSPLRALIGHLRGVTAGRARLGFLSHAPQDADGWSDIAARLGCEVAFIPQIWLDRLPDGARFASISVAGLLMALDEIAQSKGCSDVVLIVGLDLLLTRLDPDQCARFWDDLHPSLPHRPRALILALPHSFARFGPDSPTWGNISARLDK